MYVDSLVSLGAVHAPSEVREHDDVEVDPSSSQAQGVPLVVDGEQVGSLGLFVIGPVASFHSSVAVRATPGHASRVASRWLQGAFLQSGNHLLSSSLTTMRSSAPPSPVMGQQIVTILGIAPD